VTRSSVRLILALLLAATAVALAACGSDDDADGSSASSAEDRKVEKAFLAGMAHHHETAIEMAQIAQKRGDDASIKALGDDIASTQEREVEQMQKIHERLFEGPLEPDPAAHDGLGLSAAEAGMTHTDDTNKMLEAANPFDRAFVDEMVPHHVGAIKMAKVVLKSTDDSELKELANGIITTQEREVADMNSFRTKNFGGPVPAGGGSKAPTEEHGGGHSG
jgi:uncharacterized protein (DUF305 family)